MRDTLSDRRGLFVGIGIAALLAIVLLAAGEKESLVIGTITGAAYGLVALGLVLIYKSSGVFNFAQGEFGTVALYVLYLLDFKVPYGVAVVGALLAAVVMGLLVERLVVRPLFDAPRVTLLVATAGVALLAVAVEIWFGGAQGKAIDRALPTLDRVTILGVQISDQRLALIVILVVLAVVLGWFFNRTNLGLAILGASQEPHGHGADGHQRPAAVRLHLGAGGAARWPGGGHRRAGDGQLHARRGDLRLSDTRLHRRGAGRDDEPAGRVPGWRDHRDRPIGGRERTDLRRRARQSRDPDRVRRARRGAWRSARRASWARPADGPHHGTGRAHRRGRARSSAVPTLRARVGGPGGGLGLPRLAGAAVPPEPARVRGAALHQGRRLRHRGHLPQRAARLCRPDLPRSTGLRRDRRVHVGLHDDRAGPLVLGGRDGGGGDRGRAGPGARGRVAAHPGALLRARHPLLRPRGGAEHLPDRGAHRRWPGAARAQAPGLRDRLALLLPVRSRSWPSCCTSTSG